MDILVYTATDCFLIPANMDNRVSVLGVCAEKWWYFSGGNELR